MKPQVMVEMQHASYYALVHLDMTLFITSFSVTPVEFFLFKNCMLCFIIISSKTKKRKSSNCIYHGSHNQML